MRLEEIRDIWERDCIIDESELGKESLRVQRLHSKYNNFYTIERENLIKYENKISMIRRKLWMKYKGLLTKEDLDGEPPFQLDLKKEDLTMFIESDPTYIETISIIKYIKIKIDLLESIIRRINSMSYDIKSSIEFLKFINGIN